MSEALSSWQGLNSLSSVVRGHEGAAKEVAADESKLHLPHVFFRDDTCVRNSGSSLSEWASKAASQVGLLT
jgi:hypothetical protein